MRLRPPSPQGTSSDVPVYLRYEGQLRNLRLKKADVVRALKDIWKEKASEDEKVASSQLVIVAIQNMKINVSVMYVLVIGFANTDG